MKAQVLQIINEVKDNIQRPQSIFTGSIFTSDDLLGIINHLSNSVSVLPDEQVLTVDVIPDDVIKRIVTIAMNHARVHSLNCGGTYGEFATVHYDTCETRSGRLDVTATIEIDGDDFFDAVRFDDERLFNDIKQMLNDNNTQRNA